MGLGNWLDKAEWESEIYNDSLRWMWWRLWLVLRCIYKTEQMETGNWLDKAEWESEIL